jgi:4'-phosphopantetheinyl transferase
MVGQIPAPARLVIVVWLVRLDEISGSHPGLVTLLDWEEQQRMARYHFAHDARRFAARRAALRIVLGRAVNERPERLQFAYGPFGKPTLSALHGSGIHFNIAHSHGTALHSCEAWNSA